MKNLICLLLCFTIVNFAIGQTSNENRIKELPTLIEEAADKKDFNLALKLEDELAIREELQEAIDNEDYKKATALREDLYDLERGEYDRSKSNSDRAEQESEREPSKNNSIFYMDFAFAGLNMYDLSRIELTETYDQNGNYTGMQEQEIVTNQSMYSINFKLGHKFYFGPGDRDLRVGLDINYLSLNLGFKRNDNFIFPNLAFSTPCPGLVMTYHINENMGFDLQANIGIMFAITPENSSFLIPSPGVSINPQARFWYKNFGLGFQYFNHQVQSITDIDRLKLNHYGLFVGFRF